MTLRRVRRSFPLLGLALSVTACMPGPATTDPRGVDPKFGASSFIEEGNLVALAVSVRAAGFRRTEAYLPLEIAIANKGLESLTLTPEAFTLVDAAGKRYGAVSRDVLSKAYPNTDLDRRLGEVGPLMRRKFSSYARIPCNMTPGFDDPVARARVFVPRFGYVTDFLYFPRPPAEAMQKPLELFVSAPELSEPVFVTFSVTDGGR